MYIKFSEFIREAKKFDFSKLSDEDFQNLKFPIDLYNKFGDGSLQNPIKLKTQSNEPLTTKSEFEPNDDLHYFVNSLIAAKKNQKYIIQFNDTNAKDEFLRFYTNPKIKGELQKQNLGFAKSLNALKAIFVDNASYYSDDTFEDTFAYDLKKLKITKEKYLEFLTNSSQPLILTTNNIEYANNKLLSDLANIVKYVIVD